MADTGPRCEVVLRASQTDVAQLSQLLADLAGGPRVEVPLIAPAMLLGAPEMAEIARLMAPPSGMAVVHEAQVFRRIAAQDTSGAAVHVQAGVSEKPSGRVFDFQWGTGDAPLGEMQTRLRFVTPDTMHALKGSAFPPHQDRPEMIWAPSAVFDGDAVRRYLALAHDPNPIHVDDAAARAVGLVGAVVPGMALAGVVENMVARAFPGRRIHDMKVRFMAALPVGQAVRYGVLPRTRDASGDVVRARVFMVTQERVIAGIADLELASEPQATT